MSTQKRRLDALSAQLKAYGQEVADYDQDVEEDLRPFYAGTQDVAQWCCVTRHGEKVFFLPVFDDSAAASARAVYYVSDDLYAEAPVAIVDLDTGEKLVPDWSHLPWIGGSR